MATSGTADILAAIGMLEKKMGDKMKDMDDRMSTMKEELMNDREDAEDRLVKKIKLDKVPTFMKKAHEKQYIFNSSVEDKLAGARVALEKTPVAVEKAKELLKEGEELIKNRQKQIKIADRSEFGWVTVDEYVDDELAEDSDDEKRLFRAEGRAKRKVKTNDDKKKKLFTKRQSFRGRDSPFQRQPMPGLRYPRGYDDMGGRGIGSFNHQIRKPEGLSLQGGVGPCFQCGKLGHLRKNCPVQHSRQ